MDKYLNTGIKEVITAFPPVGDALNEYNIGCVPCAVGTCLLKDVVKIHALSPENEQRLMSRIENIIYPRRKVSALPPPLPQKPLKSAEIKYSPPLRKLVEEHALIKRLLALIPAIVKNLDMKKDKKLVLECADFIRNFADKYHHAKEEDILFKYFDPELDVLKVMHADHTAGRGHVKALLLAVKNNKAVEAAEHLAAYGELLSGHIKREDEVLYPWMDRTLSTSQIGNIHLKFSMANAEAKGVQEKYEKFTNNLENRFKKGRKEK